MFFDDFKRSVKIFRKSMSCLSCVFLTYAIVLGTSYNSTPISLKITSPTDFLNTEALVGAIARIDEEIDKCESDYTAYDFSAIANEISTSCRKISHGIGLEYNTMPKPKELRAKNLYTKLGIFAFFSFPTAEVNVNTQISQFLIPFTIAHEFSHFLGASNEEDADFLAFVICFDSQNSIVKESALFFAMKNLLSDLYRLDKEMYIKVYNNLSRSAKDLIELYNNFSSSDNSLFRQSRQLNHVYTSFFEKENYSVSLFSRLLISYTSEV